MTSSYISNLLNSVIVELPVDQPINFCNDDSTPSHSFNVGGNLFQNPDMGVTATVSLEILAEASEGFGKHHRLFSEYTERLANYAADLVLILFDIAHGTELYVPNKASILIKVPEVKKDSVADLCDLIGIAENLGLGHLLGPYLEHLIPAQYDKNNIKASLVDVAAWLAWKIGAEHLYGDMIDHLAFICKLD